MQICRAATAMRVCTLELDGTMDFYRCMVFPWSRDRSISSPHDNERNEVTAIMETKRRRSVTTGRHNSGAKQEFCITGRRAGGATVHTWSIMGTDYLRLNGIQIV